MRIKFVSVALLALLLSACSHNDKAENAESLYQQARQEYQMGHYSEALFCLDSLRSNFHDEIEPRKKGILLRKEVMLKAAQTELTRTDSALQVESRRYAGLQRRVLTDKGNGVAIREELNAVTSSRIRRDSLQVRFDVLCGQIRYIHKKQSEDADLK